jgi:hypothetical protein
VEAIITAINRMIEEIWSIDGSSMGYISRAHQSDKYQVTVPMYRDDINPEARLQYRIDDMTDGSRIRRLAKCDEHVHIFDGAKSLYDAFDDIICEGFSSQNINLLISHRTDMELTRELMDTYHCTDILYFIKDKETTNRLPDDVLAVMYPSEAVHERQFILSTEFYSDHISREFLYDFSIVYPNAVHVFTKDTRVMVGPIVWSR